ncbi:MAG: ATP-dependent nuclease [Henriciella sp.]
MGSPIQKLRRKKVSLARFELSKRRLLLMDLSNDNPALSIHMILHSARIKNFKGAEDVTLTFGSKGKNRILTLIGLNESGKTTILEALHYFNTGESDTDALLEGPFTKSNLEEIIPRHEATSFSDEISIQVRFELTDNEVDIILQLMSEQNIFIDRESLDRRFSVTQVIRYVNSEHKANTRYWTFGFEAKTGKQRKARSHRGNSSHEWLACVRIVSNLFPKFCYFPTFLFDFPQKIYLEETEGEDSKNRYFRELINDIVGSLGKELTVKDHIVNRIRATKQKEEATWTWFGFLGSTKRSLVDQVALEAANEVSKTVFSSWKRIFNRDYENKRVEISVNYEQETDSIYAEFFVVDGAQKFKLADRSLGFRWFFCFLLFTHFRARRETNENVLFLFDEPASNLHSRAQSELLQSFEFLAADKNYVVYSTHSHHMIEPKWLNSAYIVSNRAVDPDNSEIFSTNPTQIEAQKYREFVGNHPNKRTYFYPILEKLDYAPSDIELASNALLVEGLNDWCVFTLAAQQRPSELQFNLIPGTGAGALDPIISILTGWGRKTSVFLDSDKPGKKSKAAYAAKWQYSDAQLAELHDFDNSAASMEKLVLKHHKDEIAEFFSVTTVKKMHVTRFLRENLATGTLILDDAITKTANAVLDWAEDQLGS